MLGSHFNANLKIENNVNFREVPFPELLSFFLNYYNEFPKLNHAIESFGSE